MKDSIYYGLCDIAKRVNNPIMRQRIYGLALARSIKLEKQHHGKLPKQG